MYAAYEWSYIRRNVRIEEYDRFTVTSTLIKCLHIIQAAEQDYEKEKLNERIAKLSGGVAVIQVTMIPSQ